MANTGTRKDRHRYANAVADAYRVAEDLTEGESREEARWHRTRWQERAAALDRTSDLLRTARRLQEEGRVRETLDQPDPAFPPGSARFENRHYLLVRRPTDWGAARQTAELSGGNLAVPSELSEAIWIEGYLTGQKADGGTWLGGSLDGEAWTWTTGETWALDRWADGAADREGSVLMAGAEGAWTPAAPDSAGEAFLIEWSTDHEASVAESTKLTPATGDVAALQKKCAELVTAAIKEREKGLVANARSFQWDLDVWYRGLSRP